MWVLQVFSDFPRLFWLFRVPWESIWILGLAFLFLKNVIGILTGIAWILEHFGSYWHLKNIESSSPLRWNMLPIVLIFFTFFFFFVFLGLHPWHMEVPTLVAKLELYLLEQKHRIRAMSVTYTIAHSNAGCLTHRARPGIEFMSSWMLVRFVSTEPRQDLLIFYYNFDPLIDCSHNSF